MAIDFHWCGCHESPTTGVRLVFRATTNETVTATLNGETKTADADTAVNDGCVKLDWTGLSPDTVYDVTVTGYAPRMGVRARTWPTDSLRFVHASCHQNQFALWARKARELDPHVILINDDYPYVDRGATSSYTDVSALVNAETDPENVTNYWLHHRRDRASQELQYLFSTGANLLYMWGDHELPYNNWDNKYTMAQFEAAFSTQLECDAAFNAGRQGAEAYMLGNPDDGDSAKVNQKPRIIGGAQTPDNSTPASNYPPLYFRVGNEAIEFFMCDTISHRSPLSATDDSTKTMLGSVQRAWLQDQVEESTAAFKIWVHGKTLWPPITGQIAPGVDRYPEYSTERDGIIFSLKDHPCVFTIVGDQHVPHVSQDSTPFCNICATPAGVPISNIDQDPSAENLLWSAGRPDDRRDRVFGYGSATTERCDIQIIKIERNRVWWSGFFTPDSNAVQYPTIKTA